VRCFVIEYFVKPLKIIQGHWNWYHSKAYRFLFASSSNYGHRPIFNRFDTIHERDRHPARHRTTA